MTSFSTCYSPETRLNDLDEMLHARISGGEPCQWHKCIEGLHVHLPALNCGPGDVGHVLDVLEAYA